MQNNKSKQTSSFTEIELLDQNPQNGFILLKHFSGDVWMCDVKVIM